MAVKVYQQNKSARRKASIVDRSSLHGGSGLKKLTKGRNRVSGRGRAGKITIRHRGGGAKRLARAVDFGQEKLGIEAKVERLDFDPNRSGWLALLLYVDGDRRYRLAWQGAKVGDRVLIEESRPISKDKRWRVKSLIKGLGPQSK